MPIRPGPGLVARPPVDVPAPPAPEVDPIDIFRPEPVVSVPAEPEPVEEEPVELEPAAIEWPEPTDVIDANRVSSSQSRYSNRNRLRFLSRLRWTSLSRSRRLRSRSWSPSCWILRATTIARRHQSDSSSTWVPTKSTPAPVSTPSQPRVPALAATAPAADKSGIFGAVRAAFVRNKGSHEHEFVEAPGGIGIHRNICSECGYISIGVSESEIE